MIPESKFSVVKKQFETGLELEEAMETRMAYGSDEWVSANARLQYLYELVGAVFSGMVLITMTETHSRPLLYKDIKSGEIICVSIEIEGEPLEAEYLRVAGEFLKALKARGGNMAWAFFGMSWFKKSKLHFRNMGDKEVSAWTIAKDLAKLTDLGVDEAHDVVVGIIKKRGKK